MNTHLAVVNNVPTEAKVEEEDLGGGKEAWSWTPSGEEWGELPGAEESLFPSHQGWDILEQSRHCFAPMNHHQYPECCSTKDGDVTAPRQQDKLWEHLESPSKGRRKTPLWPLWAAPVQLDPLHTWRGGLLTSLGIRPRCLSHGRPTALPSGQGHTETQKSLTNDWWVWKSRHASSPVLPSPPPPP